MPCPQRSSPCSPAVEVFPSQPPADLQTSCPVPGDPPVWFVPCPQRSRLGGPQQIPTRSRALSPAIQVVPSDPGLVVRRAVPTTCRACALSPAVPSTGPQRSRFGGPRQIPTNLVPCPQRSRIQGLCPVPSGQPPALCLRPAKFVPDLPSLCPVPSSPRSPAVSGTDLDPHKISCPVPGDPCHRRPAGFVARPQRPPGSWFVPCPQRSRFGGPPRCQRHAKFGALSPGPALPGPASPRTG